MSVDPSVLKLSETEIGVTENIRLIPSFTPPIIQVAYPPIMDKIEQTFGALRGRAILYAWGEYVFNPMGVLIPKQLMFHEWVHGQRQGKNPEGWWEVYMADTDFRLREEILAHRGEYDAFCMLYKDRNVRSNYLTKVARKLASPLYGSMVSFMQAKKVIEALR